MARRQPSDDPKVVAEWRSRVERWRASGMTVGDFATQENVRTRQLAWWLGEVTRIEQGRPRKRRAAKHFGGKRERAQRKDATQGLTFIEMPSTRGIEIVLTSGVTIRVPAHFESGSLARVLEVLERGR